MNLLATVRKTIAAVLGAIGTWCAAVLPQGGTITAAEWVALGIALATALGVYSVANNAPTSAATRTVPGPRKATRRGDAGQVGERLVVAVLIVAGAIVAAHFIGWLGLLILLLLFLLFL